MSASPYVEFEAMVLERLRVATRTHLSPQMASSAVPRVYLERDLDQIAVELSTHVYRHKVDAQTVRVPFSKTAEREAAPPRYIVPAFAVLVVLCMLAGAATSALAPFLLAGAVALAGVVIYAANPPRTVTLTVEGEAVVERELFNAFPENTMQYPEGLGDMWIPMQQLRSYARYDDGPECA